MTKISVALCTYNGSRYLAEQLESIAGQTRPPDEIIVCDDRSTDATVSILESFRERVSFPVSISTNETNLGSTANFENAISLCTGEIIFLADQDDFWHPAKIARLAEVFEDRPEVGAVFSNAEVVDQNLRPVGVKLWDVTFPKVLRDDARENGLFDVMLWQNVVTGATMAFRADLRTHFMPIPEGIPNVIHDAWIALIASAISVVEFIDEPLIEYRQHESQQLGLGLYADVSVNEEYARSIAVHEREKVRLAKIGELLKTNSALSKRRPRESITKLIERKDKPLQHYKARMSLPDSHLRRIIPVISELLTGRYHAVSHGFRSAIKDIVKRP